MIAKRRPPISKKTVFRRHSFIFDRHNNMDKSCAVVRYAVTGSQSNVTNVFYNTGDNNGLGRHQKFAKNRFRSRHDDDNVNIIIIIRENCAQN